MRGREESFRRGPRRRTIALLLCAFLGAAPASAKPPRGGADAAGAPQREAPDCAWQPMGGSPPITLRGLRGKVVLVDFWASWCPACCAAFPFLDELARDFGERGLDVVGVNLDQDPEAAAQFVGRHPAGFTLVAGETARCAEAFGVDAMPMSYLIDRRGIIRWTRPGYSVRRAKEVRAKVIELLGEGLAHEASR